MGNQRDRQPVTEWLAAWREGDQHARTELFALIYPQLQHIATRLLRRERSDHTLEPAALVNEVAIRLLGSEPIAYNDRTHFFALAARSMRRSSSTTRERGSLRSVVGRSSG